MPIVLPNQGLPALLGFMLKVNVTGEANWILILFKSNTTPDQDTEAADLTECDFGGYSAETLTRSTWTTATVIADHAVSTYDTTPIIWTCSSGTNNVYGYAILNSTGTVLYFIERFASAPIVVTTGGVLVLLPRLTLTTEP